MDSTKIDYTLSIYVLSISFFCVFVGFNTAQSLVTTVIDIDLAHKCLATLYACFTVMSILSPRVVSMLGPRLAMVVGAVPYPLLVLSNLKPSYALSIPAFALVGFGAAVLWTAQGVYLGRSAVRHALAHAESPEDVTSRFNGIFFAVFQFNGAVGLLTAFIVETSFGEKHFQEANWIIFLSFGVFAGLGVLVFLLLRSAPPISTDLLQEADEEERQRLVAEDGGAAAAPSGSIQTGEEERGAVEDGAGEVVVVEEAVVSLYDTLRLAYESAPMQLMLPLIFYNGMSLGFLFSDFASFFASRTDASRMLLHKSMVPFAISVFYGANAIASYGFGRLASTAWGRRGVMVLASLSHLLFWALITLFYLTDYLKPSSPLTYTVVFGLAVLFALGDSVWESQAPAVLQSPSFFPEERDRDAAMSNLKMWQSLGFAVQFALGLVITEYWINFAILGGIYLLSILCLFILNNSVRSLDADQDMLDSHSIHSPKPNPEDAATDAPRSIPRHHDDEDFVRRRGNGMGGDLGAQADAHDTDRFQDPLLG